MSFKFGQIVASIENLSEDGALGATDAALSVAQTGTDVAEGNAEQIKEATEIDYMDAAIESAQDANDKVEDLLEAAEDTMKEGGMSASEAKLLEISHESILNSIGMSHRNGMMASPITSLESYESSRTKQSATMVTVESLKDSAKSIAANIVRALKAALATVVNFISGLLKNRFLMEKHLENLIKQVEKIDASMVKKKEKFATAAGALTIQGNASPETARKLLDSASKMITVSSEIASSITSSKDAEASVVVIRSAVNSLGKGLNGGYGFLTNSRSVKVTEEDGSVKLEVTESAEGAKEIEAPTKEEMLKLARQALSVVKELRAFEKTQTKLKDGVNAIIARLGEVADVVRSKVGSEESKAKYGEAAEAKKKARIARSMLSKAGGTFPNAAFQAVKAVSDYVTAGYRNYGAKKAEEK